MLARSCKLRWILLSFTLCLCSYLPKSLAAEDELAQKLVGKWEGTVLAGANEQRTLSIQSVVRDGDQWIAHGRYGQGENGRKVEINVTQNGSEIALRFRAGGANNPPVELKLTGEKELTGNTQVLRRRSLVDVPVKLTKVEP